MRIEITATDAELLELKQNHSKVLTVPFNEIRLTNTERTYKFEDKKISTAAIVGNLSGQRTLLVQIDESSKSKN